MYYCISCAIHPRIIALRFAVDRRKRDTGNNKFMNKKENKPKTDVNKEKAKLV